MATEQEIIALFRDIYLFATLTDEQLKRAAQKFETVSFRPQETIVTEGDPGNTFFIIHQGEVAVTRKVGETVRQLDVLVKGDFFGEESLLKRRRRSASVSAVGAATLLKASEENFYWLITEFPQIKTAFDNIIRTRKMVHSGKFKWLNDDEIVYQIRRKHVAALIIELWKPLLVLVGALAALGVAALAGMYQIMILMYISAAVGLIALAGTFLWLLWVFIDWGNDYYIVTSQRVVWVEVVIFFYESQIEAPLGAIMSVDMSSTLMGRWWGFGDVVIGTYTGKIIFRMVGDPHQMVKLIEEYWHRTKRMVKQAEAVDLQNAVWKAMGKDEKVKPAAMPSVTPLPKPAATAKAETPGGYQELSNRAKYFGSIFQVRLESGNTITYRKHWIILLRKTMLPDIAIIIVFALMLAYLGVYFSTTNPGMPSPAWIIGFGLFFFFLVLLPWWLYNYIDWRNDIYQVTDKNIFDIERKPLGTEIRKSASLENILSLEHKRPGFLGYLLNYGPVIITVGDVKFIFQYVHQPARVQSDIFTRMNALRIQKQRTAAVQERERTLALLTVYHRNLEQWLKDDLMKDSKP
jgi:hypothetical protein